MSVGIHGTHFTVEVVLPATQSVGPIWIDRRSRRPEGIPFSELPGVTVEASGDHVLREVLGRAGSRLGVGALNMQRAAKVMAARRDRVVSWEDTTSDPKNLDPNARFEASLYFAGFVRPGDEEHGPALVRDKRLLLRRVTIVDATGLARWDKPAIDATIEELVRTADAGLLDGDPLRPYLIVAVPAGDFGVGADWGAFESALQSFVEAVIYFGGAYSAFEGAKAIVDRLGGARDVISRHRSQWGNRGGRPEDLEAILGARPRSSQEVAALLGCSLREAESLLWGLGFKRGESGQWHPDRNPSAGALEVARHLSAKPNALSPEVVRDEVEKAFSSTTSQEDAEGQEE